MSTYPQATTGARKRPPPVLNPWMLSAAALAVALVGVSGHAWAAKKLAIMASEGGGSDPPVRAQITKALKKHKIKVVGKPKGAAPSDDGGWVALGRKLKVDGFVVLGFEVTGRKRSVEVTIRNAGDGSTAGNETFNAKGAPKKLATAVGKGFWNKLKSAIEGVGAAKGESTGMPARDLAREEQAPESKPMASEPEKSPTETETPPAAPKAEEKAVAPVEAQSQDKEEGAAAAVAPREPVPVKKPEVGSATTGRLPALIVTVAPHVMSRAFFYTPASAAPTSKMTMPTIAADATWFPLTNLGVNVGGEFASWLKYLTKYPTITTEIRASLLFRLQLSFGQLFAQAGGFRHFTASQDDGNRTRGALALPDVVYAGARVGAGARFWLSQVISASVAGSYRLTTSLAGGTYGLTTGPYFPGAAAGPGFDGAVIIAMRLSTVVEIQAGADVRRYAITTRAASDARINATYATDQYLSGWVGVSGVFGGR